MTGGERDPVDNVRRVFLISGAVELDAARQAAEEIARSVPGLNGVRSELVMALPRGRPVGF